MVLVELVCKEEALVGSYYDSSFGNFLPDYDYINVMRYVLCNDECAIDKLYEYEDVISHRIIHGVHNNKVFFDGAMYYFIGKNKSSNKIECYAFKHNDNVPIYMGRVYIAE